MRPFSIASTFVRLTVAFVVVGSVVRGEEERPLTTEEARAALQKAHWPRRTPGFYYRCEVQEAKGRVKTTETWEWLRQDGARMVRTEVRRQRDKGKPAELSRVSLVNPEGWWSLHERVAIKQSLTEERERMTANMEVVRDTLARLQGSERDEEFAQLGAVSGVRAVEDGRTVLVVTLVYGERMRKMMQAVADEALARSKKQVPLLLRPVVSAAIFARGGVESQLPEKRVTVIEESTGLILRERNLKRDGTEVGSNRRGGKEWQRCEPVPLAKFAVPAELERIEAHSLFELIKLESRYAKQDRELRTARAKSNP